MTSIPRPLSAFALAALVTLALTACSSSGDGKSSSNSQSNAQAGSDTQVQDFARIVPEPTKGAINMKVSDALKAAMGADASSLLVDSITAKAHPLEGAQYCALDLTFNYVNDGAKVLGQPKYTQAMADKEATAQVAKLREVSKNATAEKQKLILSDPQWFGIAIEGEGAKLLPADADALKTKYPNRYPGTWDQLVAEVEPLIKAARKAQADEAAKIPAWQNAGEHLSKGSSKGMNELDAKAPKPGVYFADDLKSATQVRKCALSATEPTADQQLLFPVKGENRIEKFAQVEFNVMKDGTISIALAGVEHYATDTAKNWIKQ